MKGHESNLHAYYYMKEAYLERLPSL
jgi:hypothetical protein